MGLDKYPKFKNGKDCAFTERNNCNYDETPESKRCPYMKYNNSKSPFDPTRWECTYKKDLKDKPINKLDRGNKDNNINFIEKDNTKR